MDTSELLDANGIHQHQSLIVLLQWAWSLGRCDTGCDIVSLSSYRVAPRRGHLERLKCICGYLLKMQHFGIRFRVHEPDFSDLETVEQDLYSVYGNIHEELPTNAPAPLGKPVQLVHCVDANLKERFCDVIMTYEDLT